MPTRKLYVLAVSVWDANDYIRFRDHNESLNPGDTRLYLFASEDDAEKYVNTLDVDNDIYNTADLFVGELTDEELLELTGLENIEDFGEDEKATIAQAIVDDGTLLREVKCPNYDFNKSLNGALLVFWSWHRYIGYARKLIELRYATSDDTEALLTKRDSVSATQCDVLLTADEVAGMTGEELEEKVRQKLHEDSWKWANPGAIERCMEFI